MKKNMGAVDRILRLVVAILIVIAYYQEIITGWLGIALLILAGIFVLTSVVSICPLYSIFGVSSCPAKQKESE